MLSTHWKVTACGVQGAPSGLVGALEHLELAPRGSGGIAAPAPDLLAELENIKTPPAPG